MLSRTRAVLRRSTWWASGQADKTPARTSNCLVPGTKTSSRKGGSGVGAPIVRALEGALFFLCVCP